MSEPLRQLAAIMFTDIVGYTALMGKDQAKALEIVRLSKEIQKPLVEKFNGKWLKEMGDGAMAQFSTALDAVNCAIEIQRASRADFEADIRIGIHMGDITIENNDIYGDGVNIASRLEAIADPGGIYVSDAIEKSIRGQLSLQAKYLGEVKLKNVDYGFRTYALQGVGLPIPQAKEDKELSGHFMAELNRRGVFRTTLAYLGLGTLVYMIIPLVTSIIDFPPWSNPVLFTLLIVGLPISIYLSWAYERSPEGIVRTTSEKSWQNPYSAAKRKPMTGSILIGAIWVLVLVLILFPGISDSRKGRSVPELDKSIAVLPFTNMSNDPEQEYFCDGISEELINLLTRVEGLHVAARTSAFSFKGKNENVRKIANELGVAMILEGSVRKSNNSLRITAQLINANDGFHIWSDTYNREMEDIFEIQDEISAAIVEAMKLVWLDEGHSQEEISPTKSIEAYDLYLLGRHHARAFTSDSFKKAINYFQQAINADPEFALAYSALAYSYIYLQNFGDLPQSEGIALAKIAVEKALEIEPDLAEAYVSKSNVLISEGNPEEAEVACEKALEISPNSASALSEYSLVLRVLGKQDLALIAINKAVLLDPISESHRAWQISAMSQNGLYSESKSRIEKWIAEDPVNPFPYEHFGNSLAFQGLHEQAVLQFIKAHQLRPGDSFMAWRISFIYNYLNDSRNAKKWLEEAAARAHRSGWTYLARYQYLNSYGTPKELESFISERKLESPEKLIWFINQANHNILTGDLANAENNVISGMSRLGYFEGRGRFPENLDKISLYAAIMKAVSKTDEMKAAIATYKEINSDFKLYTHEDSLLHIYGNASIAALEDDRALALTYLNQATDMGLFPYYFLEKDPVFTPYRVDPDFQSIVVKLKNLASEKKEWLEANLDTNGQASGN